MLALVAAWFLWGTGDALNVQHIRKPALHRVLCHKPAFRSLALMDTNPDFEGLSEGSKLLTPQPRAAIEVESGKKDAQKIAEEVSATASRLVTLGKRLFVLKSNAIDLITLCDLIDEINSMEVEALSLAGFELPASVLVDDYIARQYRQFLMTGMLQRNREEYIEIVSEPAIPAIYYR